MQKGIQYIRVSKDFKFRDRKCDSFNESVQCS